jgi:adhesin HecA-like repeat protein
LFQILFSAVVKTMKKYYVPSIGTLYKISLDWFAEKLINNNGKVISSDEMELNEVATLVFRSGTGTTKTTVTRIE